MGHMGRVSQKALLEMFLLLRANTTANYNTCQTRAEVESVHTEK